MLFIIPSRPLAKPFLRDVRKCSWRCYSSVKKSPLRVLFCGSDDFSISGLRALNNLRKSTNDPSAFGSIDVVCRPGKRTGRGLKTIREMPIKSVAEELNLPIHEIDTFTRWALPKLQPSEINLIIAVSFGLFVPPRILRSAEYGGINVHPSLLPDFRGPAPLQHTILAGRKYTGITIQTLGDTGFDQGQILAQTPFPGLEIPSPDEITYPKLLDFVTPIAGDMLSKYVQNTHLQSRDETENETVSPISLDNKGLKHAPKITPADREIDWENWNAEEFMRRYRALGRLWTTIRTKQGAEKRVNIEELEILKDSDKAINESYIIDGLPEPILRHHDCKSIVVLTKPDNQPILIKSITVEGKKKQNANVLCSWEKTPKMD